MFLGYYLDVHGNDVLVYWVDNNKHSNRFLVVNLEIYDLTYYLEGSLSLYNIIKFQDEVIIVDTNPDLTFNTYNVKVKDLPEAYLPEETSYYNKVYFGNEDTTMA